MAEKIRIMIKKLSFPDWSVPIALFFLCFISYGFQIPQWGYYWDDWAKTLVDHLYGLSGYWAYYAYDRPLSAWTHIIMLPLLGETPINWQIFNFVLRWFSTVAMWWSLGILWNKDKKNLAFAALLFVVYPIFMQQPIAVTYHQMWMQYVLYFISLGAMFLSVRKERNYWIFTIISLISMLLQLSITEYFVGVEFLRLVFIWLIISQRYSNIRKRLLTSLRLYTPYLIALIAYIIWRFFLMKLSVADPYPMIQLNEFLLHPIITLQKFGSIALLDSFYILISRWSELFSIQLFQQTSPFIIGSWIISIATSFCLAIYMVRLKTSDKFNLDKIPPVQENTEYSFFHQALFIGIVTIPLGVLPAWLIGRQVLWDFHSNRHAMAAMFGASLFWVGVIDWSITNIKPKSIWLSIMIGLAVIMNLRAGNEFRWVWTDQVRFYWQLSWRAPYIAPGTAIIFEDEPFPDQGMFSTSSAINFLYPQDKNQKYLGYWAYTLIPRFTYVEGNPTNLPLQTSFRSLNFVGETPNTLLMHYDRSKGNCWWLLDEEDIDDPTISELERHWLYISNTKRVDIETHSQDYPPQNIIGKEPDHTWCYYYEKAELFRQYQKWDDITKLGDEATRQGYQPGDPRSKSPHEWLPFIESYIHTNDFNTAKQLTISASDTDPKYGPQLCKLWKVPPAENSLSADYETYRNEIHIHLGCQF